MLEGNVFDRGHAARLLAGPVLAAALLVAGCGSSERTLKLPAVKAAAQAAGLRDLNILTQKSGWREVRESGMPINVGTAPADGPDLLQSRLEQSVLVVRFGNRSRAAHAISNYKKERPARPIGFERTCNVVVLNYLPGSSSERSRARRVGSELRKRCG
jgi:hypothetical protein